MNKSKSSEGKGIKHTEDNLVKSYKKPKELDKMATTIKSILFANGVKCDSEQFLIEDILALLIQQRTELLEEIQKMTTNIIKDRGDHFRDVTEKTEDRQNVHLLEWEKELEKIMDKNTTNLTKTGDKDFNPPEIINFDKVVFEKYEATLELKELIKQLLSSQRQQAVNETIENVEEMINKIIEDCSVSGMYSPDDIADKFFLLHNQLSQLKVKEEK